MPTTDPTCPTTPSKAGITRNADGQQIIPASQRPDGTTRREIKVRPGYRPPEDVEVYKNRTAEAWKQRGSGGIPGAASASDSENKGDSATSNKNAKRRAARKKAKEKEGGKGDDAEEDVRVEEKKGVVVSMEVKEEVKAEVREKAGDAKVSVKETKDLKSPLPSTGTSSRAASPKPKLEQTQEEKEKLAKAIRKKIRQANDLKARKEGGENLLPEQLEKVIKLSELTRQLNALGFE